MMRIKNWINKNIVAIMLVIVFIPIYIVTQNNSEAVKYIGTISIKYLNNEFYRWFTCIFYHFNLIHIFFNSLGLICVGSLVSPFIGKWKTLLIFVLGGVLAEVPYSMIVNYGAENYGGGSSGGIFALIAAFLVCYLRFPEAFRLTWRRVDLWIAFLFFIFANDNQASFLTHVFGFVAGILLATIMVVCKVIDRNETRR